jgi:cytosine/adenosine deaminase-related metal-dependent hydrolase
MVAKIYSARWLVPVSAAAIEGGAVACDGARIVGVGAREELRARFPEAAVEEFGEAAIIPGLVNCHTHLELTAMRGFLEPVEHDFLAWLWRLTDVRRNLLTEDDVRVSAQWGAVEAARAGVACVGDAAYLGEASLAALKATGLRGVVYQETINPDPAKADAELETLRGRVARMREGETGLARVGVSPHAPYSSSPRLIESAVRFAREESLPLMIHAAESAAEDDLIRRGEGLFAVMLAGRGIGWETPGVSPVRYLSRLGVLAPGTLLAHCVRADADDLGLIDEAGAAVAHCPKSNAKLGHGRAPYEEFIDRVSFGLGSDSVASNNTCDLLEEARFALLTARAATGAARLGRLTPERALHDATRGGASALGLDCCGSLEEGKQADLAVVRLGGAHQTPAHDPARALVFSSSGRDVQLTVVAGREVFRDGRVAGVDEERLRARMDEIRRKLSGA